MQYLALIYSDESKMPEQTPEQQKAVIAEYMAFNEEAKAAGVFVGGDALKPTTTATTLRMQGDKLLTTDGPFAETKEQLGGYYLLECENLDQAIEWAAKIPATKYGSVEVRPTMIY